MKKIFLTAATLGATLAGATTASAGDISVSVSTDYVSEYVFRGVSFANTAVQPGIEVSADGFTLGAWASVGLGESSAFSGDEIDIYGSYGWNLTDALSASAGFTIFHFPQSNGLFEVYAGAAYDTLLSPSFNAYYDFTLDAVTLEGSVGHGFAIADNTSFDLGITGGVVLAADGGVDDGTDDDSDYSWATGSASVGYAFSDAASIYVGANFSVNSDDSLDLTDIEDLDDILAANGLDVTLDNQADAFGTTDNTLFWVGTGFSTSF